MKQTQNLKIKIVKHEYRIFHFTEMFTYTMCNTNTMQYPYNTVYYG